MVHEIAAGCNSASSKPMAALPSSKKVARHVKMMLDRIRAAHGANQRKLERHLICSYLNSFDARCEAVRAALRGLKPHRRPKATQVYSIVRSLDPWQGTEEPVIVNWKIKDANANSCRITMDFGPINRALQYLTHRLLAATADLHPRQFAVRGGVHAAIAHVAKARAEGFGWCAEIDIADCYPSFEGEKLLGLFNLPEEVIEHVITCKDLNLTLGSHPVVLLREPAPQPELRRWPSGEWFHNAGPLATLRGPAGVSELCIGLLLAPPSQSTSAVNCK
jgi:hypothetical protein